MIKIIRIFNRFMSSLIVNIAKLLLDLPKLHPKENPISNAPLQPTALLKEAVL